jgi:BolA protein
MTNPNPIVDRVKQKLLSQLPAERVDVLDESHLHAGHAGARGGASHLRVRVSARVFDGKSPLAKHRMIHAVLQEELKQEIHALAIELLSSD